MLKNCSIILMVVALIGVGLIANAQAELLFQDNFGGVTNPASPDYGLNDNLASRLSGSLATGPTGMIATGTAWARDALANNADGIQVGSTHGVNSLALQPGGTTSKGNAAIIQANFNYAGGFNLQFDMDPVSEAGTNGALHGHAGFVFIGADDATQSYLTSTDVKTEYDVSRRCCPAF